MRAPLAWWWGRRIVAPMSETPLAEAWSYQPAPSTWRRLASSVLQPSRHPPAQHDQLIECPVRRRRRPFLHPPADDLPRESFDPEPVLAVVSAAGELLSGCAGARLRHVADGGAGEGSCVLTPTIPTLDGLCGSLACSSWICCWA